MIPLTVHVMDIGETTSPVRATSDLTKKGDVLCESEKIVTRALPQILSLSTGCCLPCLPLTPKVLASYFDTWCSKIYWYLFTLCRSRTGECFAYQRVDSSRSSQILGPRRDHVIQHHHRVIAPRMSESIHNTFAPEGFLHLPVPNVTGDSSIDGRQPPWLSAFSDACGPRIGSRFCLGSTCVTSSIL